MGFAVFALCAVLLLLFVSGAYTFTVACVRRKELPWLVEEEIEKTPMAKYYSYIAKSDQWLKENRAQDVYITSDDGLRLHGLWVKTDDAKGTVILAHGYRSTYLLDLSAALPFYHGLGLNILIPEQRAHGKSEGRFITFGVKESADMLRWIEYHNTTYGEIPVLLVGVSMGASSMLYLADKDLPTNVRGIIADCGFTSPKEIISEVFRRVIHLPAIPTIWIADLFARMFAGFSLYEKDTRKILPRSRLPVLLVHGAEDGFVPCNMSQDGFAACCEPKHLLIVEGADHGVSFLKDTNSYTKAVKSFVDKYFIQDGEIYYEHDSREEAE